MEIYQGLLTCLMLVSVSRTVIAFARWRHQRLRAAGKGRTLDQDWQVQLLTRVLSGLSLGLIVYLVAIG